VALDKELDSDFTANIQVYLKKFLDAGLRLRLMNLIKVLLFITNYFLSILLKGEIISLTNSNLAEWIVRFLLIQSFKLYFIWMEYASVLFAVYIPVTLAHFRNVGVLFDTLASLRSQLYLQLKNHCVVLELEFLE